MWVRIPPRALIPSEQGFLGWRSPPLTRSSAAAHRKPSALGATWFGYRRLLHRLPVLRRIGGEPTRGDPRSGEALCPCAGQRALSPVRRGSCRWHSIRPLIGAPTSGGGATGRRTEPRGMLQSSDCCAHLCCTISMGRAGRTLLVVMSASWLYQRFGQPRDVRRYPPPGRLFSVGGHRLHLVDRGGTGPVVLIETGSGALALGWDKMARASSRFVASSPTTDLGTGGATPTAGAAMASASPGTSRRCSRRPTSPARSSSSGTRSAACSYGVSSSCIPTPLPGWCSLTQVTKTCSRA